MTGSISPVDGRTAWGWRPLLVSIVAVGASWLFGQLAGQLGQHSAIRLPNAIALGVLLLVPPRQRFLYAGAFYLTRVVMATAYGIPLISTLVMPLIDTLAVLLSATLLSRERAWIDGATERVESWVRFALVGVLLPSVIIGLVKPPVSALIPPSPVGAHPVWSAGLIDGVTNGVALFLVVPIILRLRPRFLRSRGPVVHRARLVGLLVILAVAAVAVMTQHHPILLFLLPVPLMALVIRHGILGAVLGALILTIVVLGFTIMGVGPFLPVAGDREAVGLLWAQLFLILLMAADVVAVALLDGQRRADTGTAGDEGMYRLVAENADDLLVVLSPDDRIRYASPAASARLGVGQQELVGQLWHARVHPNDLPRAAEALIACRRGEAPITFLARVRHGDGSWRSFDIPLRLVPETAPGSGRPVLAHFRDVTDVTRRQRELEQQNLELEEAAGTDPLTGLANRRRLTDVGGAAWTSAASLRNPFSMLVVDVDHFKAYNDRYGHLAGDRALLVVADAIRGVLRRPSDFAARLGGEEFVILLPRTAAGGARVVAEALCRSVRERRIRHEGSSWGILTVSVGTACTPTPQPDDEGKLFAAADAAMYRAKLLGRNRVEDAETDDA